MRKLVITTIILLIATVAITVVYFKDLNPPGSNTSRVIEAIPDNASVIFQFTNEKSFYDIFADNTLLASVIGKDDLADIDTLRSVLLGNPVLHKYFDEQSLFVSLHPLQKNDAGLLLSIAALKGFDISVMEQLAKQHNTGMIIHEQKMGGMPAYNIYINSIKTRFYVVDRGDHIFSGSFSEELAEQSAVYKFSGKRNFVMLPEQQNSNSLANLYVNYQALNQLFEKLFSNNKNTDIFKGFKGLPAEAALSLNYKNDAFMFSGTTTLQGNHPENYLNLFKDQQPVANHLKDIFPATTAYSTTFAVSDPTKFASDLYHYYEKTGRQKDEDSLFMKIKGEAGISLRSEFSNLLGNEFAIVTTRYQEKYAIIAIKDGSKLLPMLMNVSNMATDKIGQFKYDKIPFFWLGDAFSILKHPYFMIVDNYLILATTQNELTSYYDTYFNRKFLSKMDQYNQFDNLQAERSNVAFFINFKNSQPILKRDMDAGFYDSYENNNPGWKNFYGASYQFAANDKNFYTNFCMRLNKPDTTAVNDGN